MTLNSKSRKNHIPAADKITSLFDNDWKTRTSTLRTKGFDTRTYDRSYSWYNCYAYYTTV